MNGDRDEPDVGSVADEAAKLFGALADWAKDTAHVPGAAECTYCPVCRTVHAVRQLNPEVRAQLATAATSLLQAASGLLATAVPDARPERSGVEHIDLDHEPDDWPEDPDDEPEEGDR